MITRITIENFKSIQKLDLELGRVNVLIGENGCGKTNILEAIGVAGVAAASSSGPIKGLGNEPLGLRGIRSTEPRLMRSAFTTESGEIRIAGSGTPSGEFDLRFGVNGIVPFAMDWLAGDDAKDVVGEGKEALTAERLTQLTAQLTERSNTRHELLREFRIYAPENTALRSFHSDSQVVPISVDGVGLYAHLKALSAGEHSAHFKEIVDRLALLDWFESLEIPKNLVAFERRIDIRDKYLAQGALFDQRSANEGFLFLLFYFTLLISPDTPKFFAIDNIDTSLNPKLCAELMRQIVELAKEHDKQIILTTHNPATLDGLSRDDDEQRLFVVYRSIRGRTAVHRVGPPKYIEGAEPLALSEAFLRGHIGGLPANF